LLAYLSKISDEVVQNSTVSYSEHPEVRITERIAYWSLVIYTKADS